MPAPGLTLCPRHYGIEIGVEFWDYTVAVKEGPDLKPYVIKAWKGGFRAYKGNTQQYKIGMACCQQDAEQRALALFDEYYPDSVQS